MLTKLECEEAVRDAVTKTFKITAVIFFALGALVGTAMFLLFTGQ